ncbi:GAF domain-containing protein [Chengkuizengella axinellae]|uniref:GAF domain-containing protein n=1 Tax=Chengkuizengella axinellae TaxID=3064388 RepID=A0ABT9J1Y3_9BACL|nr:GAF domain-containing protein [Chengkuizengella sp. 2205SS18-9]MDP5275618.1 GAF domain-containing protein [Chengkuizengella sp. 2205SS18-9]
MGSLQPEIEKHLEGIRLLSSSDFVGFAILDKEEYIIRWKYVSGNRNDRYKRIRLRPGKGIAGQVIKHGRPVIFDTQYDRSLIDLREYPILLAESLEAVAAVPVTLKNAVTGVLMIGSRILRDFDKQTIELLESIAEQLGSMIQNYNKQEDRDLFQSIRKSITNKTNRKLGG